jgi:YidC/Oxa1 family membrane protein insertase
MMSLYHALGALFGWLMKIIYDIVQNYGVAIILFTLCTKIILFPITYKQMKNSSKMQLINPKLEKLKKSYKNNPQKLQEEQMKLYSEEGINPMASCFPMLIQFVILFGVLDVVYRPLHHIMKISSTIVNTAKTALLDAGMSGLSKSEGLRDELYILNASQDSKYSEVLAQIDGIKTDVLSDFYEKFQILGIHLGQQPTIHPSVWNYESVMLALIPVIAGLLQLVLTIFSQIQQKRTNPEAQQQMKSMNIMMYIMPIFSIWFAYIVPAGVGFYWICSSFFSLIQTIGLNLYFTKERMVKIAEKEREKNKKKQKSGKKSLYQQLLEQQNAQNNNLNQHRKESEEELDGMSRKEVSAHNRKKLDQQRSKLEEKYGDESEASENYNDADEDASEELILARKRMAEKYGDKF